MPSTRNRTALYREGPQVLICINASRGFPSKRKDENQESCKQNSAMQFSPEVQDWLSEEDYSDPDPIGRTKSKAERNNIYAGRRRLKRSAVGS